MRFWGLLTILWACVCFLGCEGGRENHTLPEVRQGVLDLRNWDMHRESLVKLSGDWEFYWAPSSDAFLSPPPQTMTVPGRWNHPRQTGLPFPVSGTATYHLSVLLPKDSGPLGLRLNQIERTAAVYVNQQLVKSLSASGLGNAAYFTTPGGEKLDLKIQVSAPGDSGGGGILEAPLLGPLESVSLLRAQNTGYELFIVGILLIMALYHLMLFLTERKDKAVLAFSLVCGVAILRQLATDEGFLLGFFQVSGEACLRLAWLTPYLIASAFLLFYDFFLPKSRYPHLSLGLKVYGFVMAGLCLVTPHGFYSNVFLLVWYILGTIGYVGFILVRGMVHREPDSLVLFLGAVCLAIPAVVDVVNSAAGIFNSYIFPLGTIPFLLTLSYALANRKARTIRMAEALRVNNLHLADQEQARAHFFANISHELRTPLTLVQGPLDSLQKGAFGASVSADHGVFQLMRRNTARLVRLVDNFLRIAKVESQRAPDLQSLDLPRLLLSYVDDFLPLAQSRGIRIQFKNSLATGEGTVLVDFYDLETVLLNLLSNALKYTSTGGAISLKSRIEGNRVFIDVTDTGVGMGEDQLIRLFQRFSRLYDHTHRDLGGSGIGLSIAKAAAQRLGGDILVQSQAGVGSTFTLYFPFQPGIAPPVVPAPGGAGFKIVKDDLMSEPYSVEWPGAKKKKTQGRKVLLVEDNQELRTFLFSYLSQDFEVTAVADGVDGLSALERNPGIEVVISDIMVPRMDGIAFFEAARQRSYHVPFMFMTALASEQERLNLLRKGALDYILKPFSPEELKAKILSLLEWQDHERRELKNRLLSVLNDGPLPVPPPLPGGLSNREKEVLSYLVRGYSDKQIAAQLDLSQRTVSNHVGNILKKLGAKSRVEVVGQVLGESQKGGS